MHAGSASRRSLGKVTGGLFVLCFAAAVILALRYVRGPERDPSARASQGTETSIGAVASPTPAGALVGPDGASIMLMPPDPSYVPPTSAEAAIQEASEHISTSAGPTSIGVNLARFGSGDHVWVVTFDGICASVSAGPPPGVDTDCPITTADAVVNAGTGVWTYTFW